MQSQRKFIRKPIVGANLRITKIQCQENIDISAFLFRPYDLSPGGMSIYTSCNLIRTSCILHVDLTLENEDRKLSLEGEVRRISRTRVPALPYALGIKWNKISPKDEVYLANYIIGHSGIL